MENIARIRQRDRIFVLSLYWTAKIKICIDGAYFALCLLSNSRIICTFYFTIFDFNVCVCFEYHSMENAQHMMWIQQLGITCYRKERKNNFFTRWLSLLIFRFSTVYFFPSFHNPGTLWQQNVHCLCLLWIETKCKICEYLHNWMIWYSIRQFEYLLSLWCAHVCVHDERTSKQSNDRFVQHLWRNFNISKHKWNERKADENKWFVWQESITQQMKKRKVDSEI